MCARGFVGWRSLAASGREEFARPLLLLRGSPIWGIILCCLLHTYYGQIRPSRIGLLAGWPDRLLRTRDLAAMLPPCRQACAVGDDRQDQQHYGEGAAVISCLPPAVVVGSRVRAAGWSTADRARRPGSNARRCR